MKILSCHIIGYGRFRDKSIDFSEGLNVIKENNGWGKSTLCDFLTSMFYGNPSDDTHTALVGREKYRPWDGGIYGGSVTFTIDNKTYRIERIFADDESEDSYNLIDTATNAPTDDYGDRLGEEIFDMDRETFVKSVHILQGDLAPGMTDELSSIIKMYEDEKKELETLREFLGDEIPSEDELKEYYSLSAEIEVMQGQTDKMHENMPEEDKVAQLKQLFDEPLDECVIDDWSKRANRLSELRVKKDHAKLSDEDSETLQELKYYFDKKKPTKEELDIIRTEADNVSRLQGRIEETKENYNQQQEAYDEAVRDKSAGNSRSTLVVSIIISAVLIIGSMASFTMVGSTLGLIIGIVGIIIAVVVIGAGIINYRRKNASSKKLIAELEQSLEDAKEKYEQAKSEYETSEKICMEFLSDYSVNDEDTMQQSISEVELKAQKYDKLLNDEKEAIESGGNALEQLTDEEMSLYGELTKYQQIYGMEDLYSSNAEVELIQRIRDDNKLYISYFADDEERSEIIRQREANVKKVTAFLNTFPDVPGDNINQKITYIATQVKAYEDISARADKHKAMIDKSIGDDTGDEDTVNVDKLSHHSTIILDDPFVNYDEDKIEKALDQLTQLAKERQILYFTCHKSRVPL